MIKTTQQIIDYFKDVEWCSKPSRIKLMIHAYNLGCKDALQKDEVKE